MQTLQPTKRQLPRATAAFIARARHLIRHMDHDSGFYRMLKEELGARGYWKNAPRGNPRAGFEAAKAAFSAGRYRDIGA